MQLQNLTNQEFLQAVHYLCSQPVSITLAYKLGEILEKVKKERAKFEDFRHKLLDKHAEKDAEGNLVVDEKKAEYILKDATSFAKEFKELQEIEVEMPKIKTSDLADLKISAKSLMALKELLTP